MQRALIEEVHHSVDELKPTIDKRVDETVKQSINTAVSSQVDSQIAPRLKQLENSAQLSTLINQAESGDGGSFDTLIRMVEDSQTPQNVRDLALKVARSIIATSNSGVYTMRQFTNNPTQPQMIVYLQDPNAGTRQATIDSLSDDYWKEHLDQLFSVMTSDSEIRVRVSAYNRFRRITLIKTDALDNFTLSQWWTIHRKEFVK